MSDETDRESALAELTSLVVPDVEPQIEEEKLGEILDRAKRASTWVAATTYAIGAVVMPAARNGHRYEAIRAGASGVAAPSFPIGQEATVSDGPDLVWREAGREFANIYDVKLAEHLCCKNRRVRSTEYMGTDERHIYEHWLAEEKRTAPIVFA